MRVIFEMSGGYGGLYAAEPLTTEVDSEALPEAERDDLVRMARAAMASVPVPEQPEMAPDLMSYRLEIVDGDHWEIVLDDRTVPEDVWPLIEYMQATAIQKRLEQQ